jgi:hypothetical protein
MRDVIIDHINQLVRRAQPQRPGYMGNGRFRLQHHSTSHQAGPVKAETDDLSPWISTTANLDWALWYIAKLLSQPGTGFNNTPRYQKVNLAVISISIDRKLNRELYVAPFLWSSPCDGRRIGDVDRERYDRARKSAIAAKEVLFYGRIFKESILADLTFTREVSAPPPLFIPEYNTEAISVS